MIYAVIISSVLFLGHYGALGNNKYVGKCPAVEPVANFQMRDMLGMWYVITKTAVGSTCLVYEFTRGTEPGMYAVRQTTQYPTPTSVPKESLREYTGILSVPEFASPGIMKVEFSTDGVEVDTSFTVFSTDYNNYAAIFTCRNLDDSHMESISILSRTKWLEEKYLDEIRARVLSQNIKARDLSVISRYYCPNYIPNSDRFVVQSPVDVGFDSGEYKYIKNIQQYSPK